VVVYLDHNATTPPHPAVLDAMRAAHEAAWANPASVHRPGQKARAELDRARAAVGALVGTDARDVVLTSGGTEANNLALRHLWADGPDGRGLCVSRIEHPSVLRAAEALERQGVAVAWVAPDPSGVAAVESFARAMATLDRIALVSLQAVNHETGVIQPVAEVAALAHARGALVHVDAVQAVGRLDPSTWAGADLVSVAGHKIRGPKGIGALACKPHVALRPLLVGGAQERGLRPGTQDAAAAAGLAVAAARAHGAVARHAALAPLRDDLETRLVDLGRAHGIDVLVNGTAPRAPHVSNLSWTGWRGAELCAALDLEGVAVSSGSACSAGTAEPSAVVTAMLGPERALGAVRVSLGEDTTPAEIDAALAIWARVLGRAPARVPDA
jgi:cysteine desulfurase